MDCREIIASEETVEFIVAVDETVGDELQPDCSLTVDSRYQIWYYRKERVPELSMERYSYTAIPKCYGLLGTAALESAGILRLQNLPTQELRGRGVLVAVIDTGIDYTHPAFLDEGGLTRIVALWDQTMEAHLYKEDDRNQQKVNQLNADGSPHEEGDLQNADGSREEINQPNADRSREEMNRPNADRIRQEEEGNLQAPYGTVYTRRRINEALRSDNPLTVVPETDENGHGTLLAGIAAGSRSASDDFTGAAPESELVVVRLRKAKSYLKNYFFVPDSAETYAESDIMNGIAYAQKIAQSRNQALVICLGLGTNNGSHSGTGPLCELMDGIGILQRRGVVIAAGNEANARHHYFGRAESVLSPRRVEISVERDIPGFYVEFWGLAPERFSLSIQSPTGEVAGRLGTFANPNNKIKFLFEKTVLEADFQSAGKVRRDQLIFLRFSNVVRGIWTVNVFPEDAVTGFFHMWLPMKEMLYGSVFFLQPDPDVTITSPSDAEVPMTVGGYNVTTGAIYVDSGRGYDSDGEVKPDFLAPAVEVTGPRSRPASVQSLSYRLEQLSAGIASIQKSEEYTSLTGTSAAAALTAGGCAQLLEWAVTEGNFPSANSVDLKNQLIRGASRSLGAEYPSQTYGYGTLQVYDAFENLRRRPE